MNGENGISKRLWTGIILLLAALLFLALMLIILISSGVFDPKPVGELSETLQLEERHVAEESPFTSWLGDDQPEGDFSIKLKAGFVSGEPDAAYGLALGNPNEETIFAMSPLGYLSIWTQVKRADGSIQEEIYVPWQTWPHVRTGTEINEIWLDVQDGQAVQVRINQELLNTLPIPVFGPEIGLWTKSYGQESVFEFEKLEIFSDSR